MRTVLGVQRFGHMFAASLSVRRRRWLFTLAPAAEGRRFERCRAERCRPRYSIYSCYRWKAYDSFTKNCRSEGARRFSSVSSRASP